MPRNSTRGCACPLSHLPRSSPNTKLHYLLPLEPAIATPCSPDSRNYPKTPVVPKTPATEVETKMGEPQQSSSSAIDEETFFSTRVRRLLSSNLGGNPYITTPTKLDDLEFIQCALEGNVPRLRGKPTADREPSMTRRTLPPAACITLSARV